MGEQSSPSPGNPSFRSGSVGHCLSHPHSKRTGGSEQSHPLPSGEAGYLEVADGPHEGWSPALYTGFPRAAGQVPWPGSGCPRSLDLAGL